MGRKLVLTGTKINNPNAPILPTIDTILPTAGALMFLDPTHPYRSWANGVPAHNAVIPNIAETQAMATTGLSSAQVSPLMAIGSTLISDGNKLERSTKGGLHVILSRRVGLGTAETLNIDSSAGSAAALGNWILANKGHSFYAAKWGRVTRPVGPVTSGGWAHSVAGTSNNAATFFLRKSGDSGEVAYPTANRIGNERVNVNPSAPTPHFVDAAWSSFANLTAAQLLPHRMNRSSLGAGNEQHSPSEVFYGYYLEDLTISGRTYAEVNTLVKAKYTRDVLTPGGRYYGDTYTDPATVA